MNFNNKLVSVLMSCFNSENTVDDSIKSILNQTYNHIELLIIDDGSTDNTYEVLSKFEKTNKHIKVYRNSKNLGLTKSLNMLIDKSTGTYIARQDADDISSKDRILFQYESVENQKLDFCSSRATILNSQKKIPGFSYFLPTKWVMKYKNPFIHGTLMIRKDALVSIGGYDERFYYSQDYELFYKLQKNNFKFKNIYEPLYVLNTENNISSNFRNEQKYYSDCVKARKSPTSIENIKFTD